MLKNFLVKRVFVAGILLTPILIANAPITIACQEVQLQNAYPAADQNGDYRIKNGKSVVLPWVWQVVDPEGLNVRCQDRTGQSNRLDMLELPVDHVLPTGAIFNGVGISQDRRGSPWIWVGSHSFGRNRCWVRANTKYVRSVQRRNTDIY
jgi:hypothetical protein